MGANHSPDSGGMARPQHREVGGMPLRPAQRGVGPERFDDRGRVILLPPQSFDEPFGLGSQGRGLAARLVARLQRRRVPQADREVAGAGHQRLAVGAEGQRPDVAGVPGQPRHLLAALPGPTARSPGRGRPWPGGVPSGWKAAAKTSSVCPRSTRHAPLSICHRRTVRSPLHEAR